jgi:pantoate--beta-alanine ligase
MSSRNAYLSAEEREKASLVSKVMRETALRLEAGEPIRTVTDVAKSDLTNAGYAVDYVEARRADTLAPFGMETAPVGATGRVLVAARLGKTRLIDNMGFQRK